MSRILIIGAGPAGICAAQALVAAGLSPVVVDSAARAGGQIYRRPPEGFTRPATTLYGSEAEKARRLHRDFDALVAQKKIAYLPNSTVMALGPGAAEVVGPEGRCTLKFDRLILASGATDRLAPVPGWELPGSYSLGAAQIALKAQGVVLGRKIVLAGSGPLLTLLACQLRQAGAEVAAILDTAPMSGQIRHGLAMACARPWVTLRGLRMRLSLGQSYHAGVSLERIDGDSGGMRALHWRDGRGRAHVTACDMVAMGWHLRADTILADLAGASFEWSTDFAQWLPKRDAMLRAGPGIYLAGDGARPLGADGAELSGRLAALACLHDLELSQDDPAPLQRALARMETFATAMSRAFPWPAEQVRGLPDRAVICRCEGITARALRASAREAGADANRAKSLSRVGMGRCQGRYCQLAGAEILAATTGTPPAQTGRLRAQSPARPVTVGQWLRRDSRQAHLAVEPDEDRR